MNDKISENEKSNQAPITVLQNKKTFKEVVHELKNHSNTIQEKIIFFYSDIEIFCKEKFKITESPIDPSDKKSIKDALNFTQYKSFKKSKNKLNKREITPVSFSWDGVQLYNVEEIDTLTQYEASLLGMWISPFIAKESGKNLKQTTFLFITNKLKKTQIEVTRFDANVRNIIQWCSLKVQNEKMKNNQAIPVHYFSHIISIHDTTAGNLRIIDYWFNQISPFIKTNKCLEELSQKFLVLKKLFTSNNQEKTFILQNLKQRVKNIEKFANFTNQLIQDLTEKYTPLKTKEQKTLTPSQTQEEFYPQHPQAVSQKNVKPFKELATQQNEKEMNKKNKKEKHKESRQPEQVEFERKQRKIQWYNELVEEEKKKARRFREESLDTNETLSYPPYPDFIQNQGDQGKYNAIMEMIYKSKNISELRQSISNNPKDYHFESLKGTPYYSMRHNEGLRYVIWEEEEGLNGMLCKHY